jgi:dTDP-4-amino-4,6-dideoxygalactose transaminase
MKIPFNKPFLTGKETIYIEEAVRNMHISGDGLFTKKCHEYFEKKFEFKKCLLTTSCTDALEMAAILIDIKAGDEVIIPSYTFVSTANPFILRGANIIFCDSLPNHPNLDVSKIEALITDRTKAIVPVHYGGAACDMDKLMEIADKYQLYIIEDAAQAIDSYYKGKPLGSFGHLAAFSFHETKNIISGEGGMLVINDEKFAERAEIIREKGTNRSQFYRGEVDKYGWIDIGSSFLPSDMIAAFLYAQLENLEHIQEKRNKIWKKYYDFLNPLEKQDFFEIILPEDYATNNGHLFAIVINNLETRSKLISHLKSKQILPVFHYLSLHSSPFYKEKYSGYQLGNSDKFSDRLLRLPFFFDLTDAEIEEVCHCIRSFYNAR